MNLKTSNQCGIQTSLQKINCRIKLHEVMFIFIWCVIIAINVHFLDASEFIHPKDRTAMSRPKPRIIGGKDAFPHAIGYQVGILIEHSHNMGFCGGSLITSSYVLTAAHCLYDVVSLEIILGARNISKSETPQIRLTTTDYTIHSEWDSRHLTNDIALVKLPEHVKPGLYIRTIHLPVNDEDDFSGDTALVSGWGRTTRFNATVNNILQYATSTILSNKDCIKIEPFHKVIKDSHLCLQSNWRFNTCDGDSGGPLVVGDVQVGIVSFGYEHCTLSKPSVFTRISKYLDWIEENSDWRRKKQFDLNKNKWEDFFSLR